MRSTWCPRIGQANTGNPLLIVSKRRERTPAASRVRRRGDADGRRSASLCALEHTLTLYREFTPCVVDEDACSGSNQFLFVTEATGEGKNSFENALRLGGPRPAPAARQRTAEEQIAGCARNVPYGVPAPAARAGRVHEYSSTITRPRVCPAPFSSALLGPIANDLRHIPVVDRRGHPAAAARGPCRVRSRSSSSSVDVVAAAHPTLE
ncbi:hypothetical protein EVAR_11189_1 [Eumeta japonica]|uniref:Uncharacterized protein n=1 Tax=Eumeta variegata TaxID=151549 RepID=A0A4C1U4H3_EUMVA|nr:hypothetical protein EVAR_11189_1 [Eumeta japonica]